MTPSCGRAVFCCAVVFVGSLVYDNWAAEHETGFSDLRAKTAGEVVLLDDNFAGLEAGLFSAPVGAHTEYHYLPEAAPRGGWTVACFSSGGSGRAWQVKSETGQQVMAQTFSNTSRNFHPLLVAGDPLWADYRLVVDLTPETNEAMRGVVFRYQRSA